LLTEVSSSTSTTSSTTTITITPTSPPSIDQLGCPIIYVDQYLIVVDKPANVLSVDGHTILTTAQTSSIESKLRAWYAPQPIYIVHRLDMETSGLLMIALTRTCAQALNQMFRSKKIHKKYIARVHGHLVDAENLDKHEQQKQSIKTWIQRHPTEKLIRQAIVVPVHTLKPKQGTKTKQFAETRYKQLQACAKTNSSWVELIPVTGQTHQLRVHLNFIGHPIWGDTLYGSKEIQAKSSTRLCLHAFELTFQHPITQQTCFFQTQPINPF
jgi:tRNA pseudouridine32 synthase/23S rRNA pseudouridine746 synthase